MMELTLEFLATIDKQAKQHFKSTRLDTYTGCRSQVEIYVCTMFWHGDNSRIRSVPVMLYSCYPLINPFREDFEFASQFQLSWLKVG